MKKNQEVKLKAKESLAYWLKPGDTVYTILRKVSRSGMQRTIGVVVIGKDSSGIFHAHPNQSVADLLGLKRKDNGVVIGGCGMDMGFHLVEQLSWELFGKSGLLKQEWL